MPLPLAFKTFETTRWHLRREIDPLEDSDFFTIPAGRDDNILWNVGHLLCSLARLTYVFSGFPLPIPETYLPMFGKGTNAREWTARPDLAEVLGHFHGLPDKLRGDFEAGRFRSYKPITIGPHSIENVEEAVAFHCFHEGLHIGKIIDLKIALGLATNE